MTDPLDVTQPEKDDTVMYEVNDGTGTRSGIFGFGEVGLVHGKSMTVEWKDFLGNLRRKIIPSNEGRVILRDREQ
ncbi:MAG TPA: hypothetical protein VL401_02080 [Alphaproteobacteria bacterium]|jgi:hypothetical protein|nr:hypothetical protein [Alphaproteobacteria bacterium]